MPTYNVVSTVTNAGTVAAPPMIRIYGDCTTPTITNQTTGATLALTGHILAGDYLEIITDYGLKSITYVTAAGVRSNAMSWLNIAGATVPDMFWSLIPGLNTIGFAAATNISGLARLYWRQRYSGL
jgi:phage-related protein